MTITENIISNYCQHIYNIYSVPLVFLSYIQENGCWICWYNTVVDTIVSYHTMKFAMNQIKNVERFASSPFPAFFQPDIGVVLTTLSRTLRITLYSLVF